MGKCPSKLLRSKKMLKLMVNYLYISDFRVKYVVLFTMSGFGPGCLYWPNIRDLVPAIMGSFSTEEVSQ